VWACEDIIQFVSSLAGVVAVTASESNGAPEAAWGDSFFFYDPDGDPADRRLPFATTVVKDYQGFDTASNLDRPGVFRLNIAVGRESFQELVGYGPAEHENHRARFDYTTPDQLLPHPVYAVQAWVSILNPAEATSDRARSLLMDAHARAAERHGRRGGSPPSGGDPGGASPPD